MADATNNKGAPASAAPQQAPAQVPFGQRPAYPQQVRVGDIAAVDAPGLNIRQHVWLSAFSGALGDGGLTCEAAANIADEALPIALERLEDLS